MLNNELENPIQTEKTISLANNSSTGNVTTDIAFENVVAVNLIYNDDFYYNPVVMTSRNLDGYLQVVLRYPQIPATILSRFFFNQG